MYNCMVLMLILTGNLFGDKKESQKGSAIFKTLRRNMSCNNNNTTVRQRLTFRKKETKGWLFQGMDVNELELPTK